MILFFIGLISGAAIGIVYIALTMSSSRMNAYLDGINNARDFFKKIVLCRDCVHYKKVKGAKRECEFTLLGMEYDDFCSRGERVKTDSE